MGTDCCGANGTGVFRRGGEEVEELVDAERLGESERADLTLSSAREVFLVRADHIVRMKMMVMRMAMVVSVEIYVIFV